MSSTELRTGQETGKAMALIVWTCPTVPPNHSLLIILVASFDCVIVAGLKCNRWFSCFVLQGVFLFKFRILVAFTGEWHTLTTAQLSALWPWHPTKVVGLPQGIAKMAQKSGHTSETNRFGWDLGESSNLPNVSHTLSIFEPLLGTFRNLQLSASSCIHGSVGSCWHAAAGANSGGRCGCPDESHVALLGYARVRYIPSFTTFFFNGLCQIHDICIYNM